MHIVHFADVHIGVENYGKTDPETGLSTRLGDFLKSFDEVVSYAIDTRADLVLCCGDAYKSRDPSQTHQREFARRLVRLSAAGIPVFLVVGNHDMPNVVGRATALEILPDAGRPQRPHRRHVEDLPRRNGRWSGPDRRGPVAQTQRPARP